MAPVDEAGLSRRVLAKVDSKLRSELDQERGEWLVKVPASPAVRAVWKRYCDSVGVPMGHGLAILLHHELASIVDEDVETLSDRLKAREAELDAKAREINKSKKDSEQRDRVLLRFKADLDERQRDVAAREQNVAAVEHRLAQEIMNRSQSLPSTASPPKRGRNEPCWCGSDKKFKYCHGR
jgi:uncharacterized protein YchJ